MVKAVVFDWGGVLIKNPCACINQYCADILGAPVETFQRIYEGFVTSFQKGQITEEHLWELLCSRLGCEKPKISSLWEDAFQAAYVENTDVFLLASRLHDKGYRIGVLSNTEIPATRYFLKRKYTQFEVTIFSCNEGTMKPEERIYEILLRRLGLPPHEVVFIDDNNEYVKAAEQIGMKTILFNDSIQMKKALDLFL